MNGTTTVETLAMRLRPPMITRKARISQDGGKARKYRLDRDYSVEVKVTIPASGHSCLIIK